jgi:hypothetical protein
MNINEYIDVANRIESLIRRSEMFGKNKDDILQELLFIAVDLRTQANRIDEHFEKQYLNESTISFRS